MRESEVFHLRGEAHHPWHLYVGVVLSDKEGKIAIVRDPDGTLVLPRETVASDDNLVRLIHKLILDQVGVVPEVRVYLGSHIIPFGAQFESPYHEQFQSMPIARAGVTWLSLGEAKTRLAEQPWGEEEVLDRLAINP